MSLQLRDVLSHPALTVADPQVLSGAAHLDRPVRWVHSTDLYDIAPLLRGDEVLLTNGVGLVGLRDAALRTYVRRLAERSVAGLFFEIGRTFDEVPAAMVDEAQQADLVLVRLQPVLRFTEVAEAVNSEVIESSVNRLRHADEVSRNLSETLAGGGTVADLVEQMAGMLGAGVALLDSNNAATARAGKALGRIAAEVPILIDGTAWGRLVAGRGADRLVLEAILDRAPRVLELCLIREQPTVARTARVRQLLIEQLATGAPLTQAALDDALEAAGLTTEDSEYVCVVFDTERVEDAALLANKLTYRSRKVVFSHVGSDLCVVVAGQPTRREASSLRSSLVSIVEGAITGVTEACCAVGPTLRSSAALPKSMYDTRTSLTIARARRIPDCVIATRSTALDRLLGQHTSPDGLNRYCDEVLGLLTLPKHRDLMDTVVALIDCGGSKSATAKRLHLSRQSLYYRLAKISRLIDVDLDRPSELAQLAVAVTARQTAALSIG